MKAITQAVILAGGAGTRLQPFTLNNPKPLVPINGRPFLEYLINLLKENGIKEVVILTGYLGDKISNYFGNGSNFGMKIKYSYTPFLDKNNQEIKSGLRIKNAEKLLKNSFLLMYCDNYWPLNLTKLINYFQKKRCDAVTTVYSNKEISTKNNMFIDKNGLITKYDKSREDENLNCLDIGFLIIQKKVLKLLPNGNSQFEKEVIPLLIKKRRLFGYLTDQKYYSIGTPERVVITEKYLSSKRVVFLDRDGVINKKAPKGDYIKKWKEFEFLPGVIKAIKKLNVKGYKVYVISNQAGIARCMMTEKDLNLIHKNMMKELVKHGTKIDDIFYCPHGWDEGCDCRKPKPGLFFKASNKYYINLSKAIFIGDDERDKQAGKTAGCKTFLVNPQANLLKIVESLID